MTSIRNSLRNGKYPKHGPRLRLTRHIYAQYDDVVAEGGARVHDSQVAPAADGDSLAGGIGAQRCPRLLILADEQVAFSGTSGGGQADTRRRAGEDGVPRPFHLEKIGK